MVALSPSPFVLLPMDWPLLLMSRPLEVPNGSSGPRSVISYVCPRALAAVASAIVEAERRLEAYVYFLGPEGAKLASPVQLDAREFEPNPVST